MVDQPTHHAILIGINAYRERPLIGCVRDVQKIKSYLESQSVPINIQIFTATQSPCAEAGPAEESSLWPTHENVTAALRGLATRTKPGHCVYIHFSGHGTREGNQTRGKFSNESTGDLALVLLDGENARSTKSYGGHALSIALNGMVRKGVVVTVVLDCCFAASIYRLDRPNIRFMPFSEIDSVIDDSPFIEMEKDPSGYRDISARSNWLMDPKGYAILAACGPQEEASEISHDGEVSGALSYYLHCSLTDNGINQRHKDVFYRLCSNTQAASVDQTPVLRGNKDQEFFGLHTLATNRPVIPVFKTSQGFVLQAGYAHGVEEGDDFIIYPSSVVDHNAALHDNMISARVGTIGPLTSSLELTNGKSSLREVACVAEPRRRHSFRRFPIALSETILNRDEWLAAFDKYSLSVHHETEGFPFSFRVEAFGDEYQILDKDGQGLLNLPVLKQRGTDLEDVAAMLEHLVRYELVKSLSNESSSEEFQASFEVNISNRDGDQFSPGQLIHAEESDGKYMFELIVQNNSCRELYLYVFNLGPLWQVDDINHNGAELIPSLESGEGFKNTFTKKLRTMVPPEMKARGLLQCDDTLKIFVTSHPSSFDLLELPKIGASPKKQATKSRDRSGKECAEEWVALNFSLRTSSALPAEIAE
ncbi:Ff.00g087120.m01.CDS01 [Fusarium sp. VM40]|nr:Ff.00g087120.m01.CDS01 [Fusarium sp. VM40]